jgi:hypothetical protein
MDMRAHIDLVEAFLHGSRVDLAPGTILKGRGQDYVNDWGDSFVYQTLEQYRPAGCLPHEQSVFMVLDVVDDIYHSGGPREGYLFTVEPIGKVQKHNIAWLDDLAEGDRDDEDFDERALALGYWLGKPHPERPDTYEYVASEAKILSVEPYSL